MIYRRDGISLGGPVAEARNYPTFVRLEHPSESVETRFEKPSPAEITPQFEGIPTGRNVRHEGAVVVFPLFKLG
jgi:hypothetical protein